MTNEKIENLISKILDRSNDLTDAEIAEITHDDYLRKLYDTAAMLKSATECCRSYNLDEEWIALKERLKGKTSEKEATNRHSWLKIAAVFIGIILSAAIVLSFFRLDRGSATDSQSIASIDSFPKESPLAKNELNNAIGTILTEKLEDSTSVKSKKGKDEVDNSSQTKHNLTINETEYNALPSIEEALFLTEENTIIAQMVIESEYDSCIYDIQNSLMTVNYGDNTCINTPQQSWLKEFIKFTDGLTDQNLIVQRGSANILYSLTYSMSGVNLSDRNTALNIISSLIADHICDNDPVTKVLIIGCKDNLSK